MLGYGLPLVLWVLALGSYPCSATMHRKQQQKNSSKLLSSPACQKHCHSMQ